MKDDTPFQHFYVRFYVCRNIIHDENEILAFRMNRKFRNVKHLHKKETI